RSKHRRDSAAVRRNGMRSTQFRAAAPYSAFYGRTDDRAEIRSQTLQCRYHIAVPRNLIRTMKVYLVDGTYELFRHYFAVPPAQDVRGVEIAAVRGVLHSMLSMIEGGATHVGIATDHVVESFRNDLYSGYKTGAGVAPELLAQFPILEEALDAMGSIVWPMVYFEADDALAAAAAKAADDPVVSQVVICTPDKDLGQCVVGQRVVQL